MDGANRLSVKYGILRLRHLRRLRRLRRSSVATSDSELISLVSWS